MRVRSQIGAMGVLRHSTWGIWAPASLRFLGVRAILQLELARLFGHAKRRVGVGFEVGCGWASGLRSAVRLAREAFAYGSKNSGTHCAIESVELVLWLFGK